MGRKAEVPTLFVSTKRLLNLIESSIYCFSMLEIRETPNFLEIQDDPEIICPDSDLWDGIFWLEACLAVSRCVGFFQLGTVMEGVREEAYRAGVLFANPLATTRR